MFSVYIVVLMHTVVYHICKSLIVCSHLHNSSWKCCDDSWM